MRIAAAALSYVSLPSSKDDPFNRGPWKKISTKKSRLFTRKFTAPIRRLGKQLLKSSSKKMFRKDKAKRNPDEERLYDEEQGWVTPAATFDTEDTLSPKSFDSLTITDSTSILVETMEKIEEVSNDSILDSCQSMHINQFWDSEATINASAEICTIFRTENKVEKYSHEFEYNGNGLENHEKENAAPRIEINIKEEIQDNKKADENENPFIQTLATLEQTSISNDDVLSVRDSMVSLLSTIDTTEIIDEDNEIGSLVPVADISFFLDDEECNAFHCTGRISMLWNERPPIEIDVDNDSLEDAREDSQSEDQSLKQCIDSDDDVSSISSCNTYLQAVGNITASVDRKVERAVATVVKEMGTKNSDRLSSVKESEKQIMAITFEGIETKKPSYEMPKVQAKQEPEFDEEEGNLCVSFNPSKSLLLSAMNGASTKARIDIEQATALALSKIDSANYASPKRETFNFTAAQNRVLGFIFFLIFLFNSNGNSFQFLTGIKMFSHNERAIQTYETIEVNSPPEFRMWGNEQMVVKADNNKTQVDLNNGPIYNVGCALKIGCLALGNI